MINKELRERIISLIHQEVVPAIGCIEPMCVALCTAKATEKLGCRPERITALLSANILKNAMGVGIPGTGMTGLPIAIALGALGLGLFLLYTAPQSRRIHQCRTFFDRHFYPIKRRCPHRRASPTLNS